MDGGQQRCPAVGGEGERQPVEVVVHQVELGRAGERVRDVHRLPDPPVEGGVLGVRSRDDAVQGGGGDGVEGGEQGDLVAAGHQPLGQQPGDLLPGSVVPRRRTPGDRPEQCDLHGIGDGELQTGPVQGEQGLQEGQGRLGALVLVQAARTQSVVAAAGREVVDRQPGAVAAEEPLEGQHGLRTVPVVAGGHHRLDQRLHQGGRLQRLLVPVVGDRYGMQPEPPLVADQPDVAGLDAALDGVPVQGLEAGPLPLRRVPAGSRPRSGPAASRALS